MGTISKPPWLKIRPPTTEQFSWIKTKVAGLQLHTVCQEAHCPNMPECWSAGTASFMILGDTCTRNCRFCAVKTAAKGKEVDKKEPKKLAKTIQQMKLKYVVITSVDRDDLPDQGAKHFAECVFEIKKTNPETIVEVLTPDFRGSTECIETVLNAKPNVFGHNLETVKRLQSAVRDRRANYEQSLSVLRFVSEWNKKNSAVQRSASTKQKNSNPPDSKKTNSSNSKIFTKSALMLGMGEEKKEVEKAMDDLRSVGVQLLSLGQYLQPSPKHFPLQRYVTPTEFEEFKQAALQKGFLFCQSGPFVRSSYRAEEFFLQNQFAKTK